MRKIAKVALAASLILFVASCATQPLTDATFDVPGFWFGLLHGIISPFALVGGLFDDVRVYAFPNNGWWYDFGFMIGVGSIFGATGGSV
jgi:hypothetical protein